MQNTHFQIFEHLYQIYPNLPQYQTQSKVIEKYEYISQRYSQIYGQQPKYFIKSPGKITIFGDNNNYSGYSTIQCSILNDIVIAVNLNNHNQIRINNFQKTIHPQKRFSADISAYKFSQNDEYFNQLLMSLKVFNNLNKKYSSGLNILIFCDFLGKTKLGKTSSLIYALVLAQIVANSCQINKGNIYEQIKKYKSSFPQLNLNQCNFYTKNNNLILLPQKELVPFFENYTFILAHSLTPEPIKLIEGKRINLRQCQIKIGIQLIKSELGIQKEFNTFKQLQNNLQYSISDLIDCVQQYVPNRLISIQQIQKSTQKPMIQILKSIPFANVVIDQNKYFFPYKRIMYLLKEQQIIQKIINVMNDKNLDENTKFLKFRQEFKRSYINSKQLLEIQSKQIDNLIDVAIQAKITHYKILGNGWGGNVLFLIDKKNATKSIQYLLNNYYSTKENQIYISNQYDQYLSEVVPCIGLSVLDPEYEIWF